MNPRYWYFITWTDSEGREQNSEDDYYTLPAAYLNAVAHTYRDDKAKPRIRVAWKGANR